MKRTEGAAGGEFDRCAPFTHVAPTVHSLRNAGVNWYRTKRPALASTSTPSSSLSTGAKPRNTKLLLLVFTADNRLLGRRRSKVESSLTAIGRFGDLKQNRPCLQVSDFKTGEVHVVDIIFKFAEII